MRFATQHQDRLPLQTCGKDRAPFHACQIDRSAVFLLLMQGLRQVQVIRTHVE